LSPARAEGASLVALTLNCGCVRFYLDHNAGRDWVPVVIRANLDRLKAAGHHLTFRAIFHMLDLDDDVIGCVPLDGQLCLGRAGQRSVTQNDLPDFGGPQTTVMPSRGIIPLTRYRRSVPSLISSNAISGMRFCLIIVDGIEDGSGEFSSTVDHGCLSHLDAAVPEIYNSSAWRDDVSSCARISEVVP
jgi:hypothetical protein